MLSSFRTLLFCTLFFTSYTTFSQAKKKSATANATINEQTVTDYLIIAGTSKDFHALESSAKDLSKKTGFPYSTFERIYKDSCIVLPDTSSDELYRNTYVFRRYGWEEISVELNIGDGIMFSPSETKERPNMILVAGMFGTKKDANERLAVIKKYIPTAYLLKKKVYMGCIH